MRAGFDVVPAGNPADVLVINSCTVTHRADRDSRALARRLRRGNPRAVLVMTGCYAQTSPDDRSLLPEVDHWIGTGEPEALSGLLRALAADSPPRMETPSGFAVDRLLGRTRMFLKIQDGCDAACAYCIVPKARGGIRSLSVADAVESARRAEEDGAREIVLTGIHAGRYGTDRGDRDGLAALLETLLSETSLCRFRLGSVEPLEITPKLVALLAGRQRVCPHLHVPLQSGSDRVLQRMRRPYTADRYRERLQRVSSEVPGIRLGADVIAGFPGETAADFEETMKLAGGGLLSCLHVFPYSARAGTESAGWRDDVPAAEKKRRVAMLRDADETLREKYLAGQMGRTLSVVAESARGEDGWFRGTSENYVDVAFRSPGCRVGELVPVRILAVRGRTLTGEDAGGR